MSAIRIACRRTRLGHVSVSLGDGRHIGTPLGLMPTDNRPNSIHPIAESFAADCPCHPRSCVRCDPSEAAKQPGIPRQWRRGGETRRSLCGRCLLC